MTVRCVTWMTQATGTSNGSPLMADRAPTNAVFLIYDGECPFCRRYADFARLSQAFPGLELISAREQRVEVSDAWRAGLDLNRDMVLHVEGKWYSGEQAILRLAEAAHHKRFRNGILQRLFGSSRYARGFYKMLVSCRLLFLRLAGRKPLSSEHLSSSTLH
jgi:predicted DCC family thiol-disulfide oxidoreductase YuxK